MRGDLLVLEMRLIVAVMLVRLESVGLLSVYLFNGGNVVGHQILLGRALIFVLLAGVHVGLPLPRLMVTEWQVSV